MSTLRELLNCEHFRLRTEMYAGERRFGTFGVWLCGYTAALRAHEIADPLFFDFNWWLAKCHGKPEAQDWYSFIVSKYGEDELATERFFALWDEFLAAGNV